MKTLFLFYMFNIILDLPPYLRLLLHFISSCIFMLPSGVIFLLPEEFLLVFLFFNEGLQLLNYFQIFFWLKNVFISSSLLKYKFTEYRILVSSCFFFPSAWRYCSSFCCLVGNLAISLTVIPLKVTVAFSPSLVAFKISLCL